MKTLYLMRHGQTLFNEQKKIQGWCDSPLTEKGRAQCEIARQYFLDQNITFDKAYCSTSERTSDTLEIVTDYSMDYKRLKGLKEWNFGAFEGKDEFLNPKYPYGDFFKAYGGESDMELRERVSSTLLDIMRQDDHDSVLVVSHGASCGQFVLNWEHETRGPKFQRGITNCAIFKFEFEDDKFHLVEIINHDFSSLE